MIVKLRILKSFSFHGLLLVLLACRIGYAQNAKKIIEFRPGKIENVAVDRLGNFFLVFKNGLIKKYDLNGKVLAELKREKSPALIEPWYHPKIFLYDQLVQQCTIFDHHLQNPEILHLDPSIAIKPLLACPTNDNKLLVLDGADFSIKKVNSVTNQVLTEFYLDSAQFDSTHEYRYLREYQNLIFLLDKNAGIEIYNMVGKKVNQIKTTSFNFGFYGEELYFIQPGKIVFYDLYSEKNRTMKIADARFALVSDERIFLVSDNGKVAIFEFSVDNLKE